MWDQLGLPLEDAALGERVLIVGIRVTTLVGILCGLPLADLIAPNEFDPVCWGVECRNKKAIEGQKSSMRDNTNANIIQGIKTLFNGCNI